VIEQSNVDISVWARTQEHGGDCPLSFRIFGQKPIAFRINTRTAACLLAGVSSEGQASKVDELVQTRSTRSSLDPASNPRSIRPYVCCVSV
jgi:hypothetical protein